MTRGDYWSADSGSRAKANALFRFVITSLAEVDPRTRARLLLLSGQPVVRRLLLDGPGEVGAKPPAGSGAD